MTQAANKAAKESVNIQKKAAEDAAAARAGAASKMQTAVDTIKYPTYLSTPEAQQYKQTIEDRIAGRGLVDVNALTSPIANQVRAGLQQTNAAIGSAASARGLNRSTIPVNQMKEASQAAERDIAERMANLELTRQQQIETAVNAMGGISEREAASQQNKSMFQREGEFAVANTLSGNADAAKQDQFAIAKAITEQGAAQAARDLLNWQMILGGVVGVGTTMSAGPAAGAAAAGSILGGKNLSSQPSSSDNLMSILNQIRDERNLATVKRG